MALAPVKKPATNNKAQGSAENATDPDTGVNQTGILIDDVSAGITNSQVISPNTINGPGKPGAAATQIDW